MHFKYKNMLALGESCLVGREIGKLIRWKTKIRGKLKKNQRENIKARAPEARLGIWTFCMLVEGSIQLKTEGLSLEAPYNLSAPIKTIRFAKLSVGATPLLFPYFIPCPFSSGVSSVTSPKRPASLHPTI